MSMTILLDVNFGHILTHFALNRIVGEAAFQSIMDSKATSSCYIGSGMGSYVNYKFDFYDFLQLTIVT